MSKKNYNACNISAETPAVIQKIEKQKFYRYITNSRCHFFESFWNQVTD
jgi:hypothetical protein